MAEIKWALMDEKQICAKLGSDLWRGLPLREAESRLRQGGGNVLREERRKSRLEVFIDQFRDFMVLVLLAATLISGVLGEYSDAVTIIIIVLLNAFLGFIQEIRAENSLEALKRMNAPSAHVVRAGQVCQIPAAELVPGDLVLLSEGDRVPADLRLIDCQNLGINEAALTGESDAVQKHTAPLKAVPDSLGDYDNMAFMGSLVVKGHGAGIAIATGMETQMGKIAHLIQTAEEEQTPLQRRLADLGKVLVIACLAVCILVVFLGIWQGESYYKMLMAGVSLAVAAIPEGLPAIVTVSLALGVQRMIRRRAIVRRLPAVETLGCATVICSDKTGTLTENRMKAVRLLTGGKIYNLEGREKPGRKGQLDWEKVFAASVLCNNARYTPGQGAQGEPTEAALLEAAATAGFQPQSIMARGERVKENPFSSSRKMMSVIVRRSGTVILYCKGAPEVILQLCSKKLADGKEMPLENKDRLRLQQQIEGMAAEALRNLAVAYRVLLPGEEKKHWAQLEQDLVFAGVMGLVDPPRPEVKASVTRCRQAGIKTVMITGDHAATARSIARQLNILPPGGRILTGSELDTIGDRELERLAGEVYVYARVSPEHKLRIVRALKARGEIVAMTGDGVNDAPAVKEANIGVAMGLSGTDVTKEAAALVLGDDNFTTIVAAVEEGRNIFDNIRKFIRFLLASNIGEILTMMLAMVLGLPLPLRPIQLLWINLVTDGLPAIALGVDPPAKGLMERPPRPPSEGIFTLEVWRQIIGRGTYIGIVSTIIFYLVLEATSHLLLSQTMTFSTLIVCQLTYVFECRRQGEERPAQNWFLYLAVLSSLLLLFLVIYYPPLQVVFQTVSLSPHAWLIILCLCLLPAIVNGIGRVINALQPVTEKEFL